MNNVAHNLARVVILYFGAKVNSGFPASAGFNYFHRLFATSLVSFFSFVFCCYFLLSLDYLCAKLFLV